MAQVASNILIAKWAMMNNAYNTTKRQRCRTTIAQAHHQNRLEVYASTMSARLCGLTSSVSSSDPALKNMSNADPEHDNDKSNNKEAFIKPSCNAQKYRLE
jgi:hypothetical protein